MYLTSKNMVAGIYTKSCTHDQIDSHLKGYFNCILDMNGEKTNSALMALRNETTEWCSLLGEEIDCFTKYLGTCLEPEITADIEIMYLFSAIRSGTITCHAIGNRNVSEIQSRGSDLISNYFSDIAKLNEIVTFDKGCSTSSLVNSILHVVAGIKKESSYVEDIVVNYYTNGFPETENGINKATNVSFPICSAVLSILENVLKVDRCFSKDEIRMAKSTFVTFYGVTMDALKNLNASVTHDYPIDKMTHKINNLAIRDYQVIINIASDSIFKRIHVFGSRKLLIVFKYHSREMFVKKT